MKAYRYLTAVAALTVFAISTLVVAGEPARHTYEGAITGVVCSACKEHVTAALTKKLPGVVSVDVKAGASPDVKKLTIVSTDAGVTKETATAALGSYAKNYTIESLAKKD